MCNLYSQTRNQKPIRDLFKVNLKRAVVFAPMAAILPAWHAPVVRLAEDGERELVNMSWGFVHSQPGRSPKRVTTVRDDKIMTDFWRPSFEQRRCLVPATSFCEPDDRRSEGARATWRWYALKGDEPRPPFAFAGIWQRYRGPIKKGARPVVLDVYSFITTPNGGIASINCERTPVLLTTDEERDTWLRGSPDEARMLIRPIEGERLHVVQVGPKKGDLLRG